MDLKKGLAYSTVSQLGYMMLAMGCGAPVAGIFHLVTHACFKAMLFLGSGSVIHAMEEVVGHQPVLAQDMRLMGGLRKKMPYTSATFVFNIPLHSVCCCFSWHHYLFPRSFCSFDSNGFKKGVSI